MGNNLFYRNVIWVVIVVYELFVVGLLLGATISPVKPIPTVTNIALATSTSTMSPTATPIPPTSTLTPTVQPTDTPTSAPTNTPVPTATPTPTNIPVTLTLTPTDTPLPTSTSTIVTPTRLPTSTPTPTTIDYSPVVLGSPNDGETFIGPTEVKLEWTWDKELQPAEYYFVEVWFSPLANCETSWLHHKWTKESSYIIHVPSVYEQMCHTKREVSWTVYIGKPIDSDDLNNSMGTQLSPKPTVRKFQWVAQGGGGSSGGSETTGGGGSFGTPIPNN